MTPSALATYSLPDPRLQTPDPHHGPRLPWRGAALVNDAHIVNVADAGGAHIGVALAADVDLLADNRRVQLRVELVAVLAFQFHIDVFAAVVDVLQLQAVDAVDFLDHVAGDDQRGAGGGVEGVGHGYIAVATLARIVGDAVIHNAGHAGDARC
jgi:hypothetical protein